MKIAFRLFLGACACAVSAASSWGVVTVIDNSPLWAYANGPLSEAPHLIPFAEPNKFAVGQTFVVPEGTFAIEKVGLFLNTPLALNEGLVSIYLAEWDVLESRATGVLNTYLGPAEADFGEFPPSITQYRFFNWNTGSLPVTPGTPYLVFMTSASFVPEFAETTKFGYEPAGTYTGGSAWILDGESIEDIRLAAWTPFVGDLAFYVEFTPRDFPIPPVPEASAYSVVATALLASVIGWRKMRRLRA